MKGYTPIQKVDNHDKNCNRVVSCSSNVLASAFSMKKEWFIVIILVLLSLYVIVWQNSMLQQVNWWKDLVGPAHVKIIEREESQTYNSEDNDVQWPNEASEDYLDAQSFQPIDEPSETDIPIQSPIAISEQSNTNVATDSTTEISDHSNTDEALESTTTISDNSNTGVTIESTTTISDNFNTDSTTKISDNSNTDVAIVSTSTISEQSTTDIVIQSTLTTTEQSNENPATELTTTISEQSTTNVGIQPTPAISEQSSTDAVIQSTVATGDQSKTEGTIQSVQPTTEPIVTDATTQTFQQTTEPSETELTIESKTKEPTSGDSNIIFIESSCVLVPMNISHGGLYLNQRQACTIESAAKANPDSNVYILYTCAINGTLEDSPDNVKGVLSYSNVKLWNLNFTEFFAGTPLEDWDFYGAIKTSQYPAVHASDIARVTSLWKWGGTYLDLDIIVFRSLATLGSNYVAYYETNAIANGILNFDTNGTGHDFATMCLEDVKKTFQGNDWYRNGPHLIVRKLLEMCHVTLVVNLLPENCKGFKVLPPKDFFPAPYQLYAEHYQPEKRDKIINMITGAYGLHLNNNFVKEWKIPLHKNHAYDYMSETYCPKSYAGAGLILH